jgi:DNA-binding beta-propeller fold protein YncE
MAKIAEITTMKIHKSVLVKTLAIICIVWTLLSVAGCRSAKIEPAQPKPIFFPPPPEKPRLQFLKSFSGPADFAPASTGAFERFVLGEPEKHGGIVTPYGLAIFEGKLYVCDIGKRVVEVVDLKTRTFSTMTNDRRLANPVNIFIDRDGMKYVADPTAGAVFVFDKNDTLRTILGKDLSINPIDVVVRGTLCYVTDFSSNQVIVIDRTTGKEISRIGRKASQSEREKEPLAHLAPGEFSLISDLALDQEGNIFVTDKAGARITEFDSSGTFRRSIGRIGWNIDEFARPKGIAIDKAARIWVVDASTEVAKIYDQQARLLLFFGLPGNEPGMMNLPAQIALDYDNVDLFQQYAVPGAKIEFLVLVTNQYGPNKVSVYGFGSFPEQETAPSPASHVAAVPEPQPPAQSSQTTVAPEPRTPDEPSLKRRQRVADLYYRSMALYRTGRLEEARKGLVQVMQSGTIPPAMIQTIKQYIVDIDKRLAERTR